MSNQSVSYTRPSRSRSSTDQDAIIRMYADRIGEKIGRLVSEIIVDTLTLLWIENPTSQHSIVREITQDRKQPNGDKLLKAAEVAEKLDISKSKAYQLMQRGEIPTVHLGQAVRVRQQDLEEFINSQLKSDPTK